MAFPKTEGDQQAEETRIEIQNIKDIFQHYQTSDYGRKLYLIQNSIFCVDIDPIACQIAKLRFFISLAIEQEISKNPNDNFGIRPLPNLETQFVIGDALRGLPKQQSLTTEKSKEIKERLIQNREHRFHARTIETKSKYREENKMLRDQLAQELEEIGFSSIEAAYIRDWNPDDQNTTAEWFDAEYMFCISKGFDIVIGNPPYVQLQNNKGELGKRYKDYFFQTFERTGDIYQLFYEKGINMLSEHGHLCLITSNKWMRSNYGKKQRSFLSSKAAPIKLVDLGSNIFDSAVVDTNILLCRKATLKRRDHMQAAEVKSSGTTEQKIQSLEFEDLPIPKLGAPWVVLKPYRTKHQRKDRAMRETADRVGYIH